MYGHDLAYAQTMKTTIHTTSGPLCEACQGQGELYRWTGSRWSDYEQIGPCLDCMGTGELEGPCPGCHEASTDIRYLDVGDQYIHMGCDRCMPSELVADEVGSMLKGEDNV
jgi:hypothetical protein